MLWQSVCLSRYWGTARGGASLHSFDCQRIDCGAGDLRVDMGAQRAPGAHPCFDRAGIAGGTNCTRRSHRVVETAANDYYSTPGSGSGDFRYSDYDSSDVGQTDSKPRTPRSDAQVCTVNYDKRAICLRVD